MTYFDTGKVLSLFLQNFLNIKTKKESMMKMKFSTRIKNGETLEGIFLGTRLECQKYFLQKALFCNNPQEKEFFKKISKDKEIKLQFDNDLTQNMFDFISDPTTEQGHVFEYSIQTRYKEGELIQKVKNILQFQDIKKMVLHLTVSNSCIPVSLGSVIRKILPMQKENSPIIFNYINEPKKKDRVNLFIMTLNTGI